MNAVTTHDIFAFLTGDPPKPGSGAERVKEAVLNPGQYADIDAALVKFRAMHKDALALPKAKSMVATYLAELNPNSGSQTVSPRATWNELFERLLVHCRKLVTQTTSASGGTGEQLVSTIISTYIRGSEAGKYAELRNPQQLWPVLLELAAKKLGRELSPELVKDTEYTTVLENVLKLAFRDEASDESTRYVLAHNLLGQNAEQIAEKTDDLADNVSATIQLLHSKFHLLLANAA